MIDLSPLGLGTAFAAGVISFLSPCVLPLVPGYLSYVTGTALDELRDDARSRRRGLGLAALFVLGFSLVFIAFGASATALGSLLLAWKTELGWAAGALIILFGLHMLGVLPIGWLEREARLQVDPERGRALGALALGAAFAFGWTPCIGPVLGAILTLGASTANVGQGTTLLAVYSAGLGVPFLLAALFTDRLLGALKRLGRLGRSLQRAAGALLVAMGLMMATGQLERLGFWLIETFPILARIG
jgi:cytochrome c-type biogenesis protein